jgi:hypothetical protein
MTLSRRIARHYDGPGIWCCGNKETETFCRPFGTQGSHFNAFPGFQALESLGYFRMSLRDRVELAQKACRMIFPK